MKFGYFDDENREYVITTPKTPLPWINYLGCGEFFSLMSNTCGGYTFYKDAKLLRLTRYRYNDVPNDINGKYFYIKDGDTIWNPGWKPTKTPLDSYECRHGMGYSRFTSSKNGLKAEMLAFVPMNDNCEVTRLILTNLSDKPKTFSVFSYVEFCLWNADDDSRNFQRNLSTGEVEIDGSTIYHKTEYRERRNHYAVYSVNHPIDGFDTIRDEFLGAYRGAHEPEVVEQGHSKNSVASGWSPIASQQINLTLQPGESETVTVSVPEYFLTSYDAYNTGVYILEEGAHYLTIADDAHAAANNILTVKGKTTADGMTADGDASMVYTATYSFDATTYAKAYGTGNDVTSLFAAADVNRYEGSGDNTVTYYSRSNWEGTVTPGAVKLAMTQQLFDDTVLTDSDLPSADGYEWPVFGKQADLQLINMRGVDADDPQWETFMDQLTFDQLAKICANGLRMTIAINEIGKPETVDHNGPSGVTQKYSVGSNGYAVQTNDPDKNMKGTCYPCNGIIAATMNSQLVQEVGELIGEDAMWAGYAGLYGTGLNIHRSPYSGRVFEYYSEDGILTGLIDARETVGIQSKGVYVYNKHFVLNDQENNRAGIGTWCNEQALREIYLRAFELPIIQADAQCVMTAFNRLGAIWAGAHTELLTGWLRGEAGMSGFAVTDMYDGTYMVKVNEIVAGNDLPDNFVGEDISELKDYGPDGAKANPMVAQALRTSAKRVLNTVVNSRGMDGISQYTRVVREATWWQLTLNIAQWALGALTAVAFVLVVLDGKKKGAKK